jgi:hypothetical protein
LQYRLSIGVKYRLLAILFILFIVPSSLSAQGLMRRYLSSLLNDTTSIADPKFIFYPTLAYAPETSWEVGFSTLFVYYANRDTTNRLSEISGFSFFTLERQYGFWFDHALYTQGNKWFWLGRSRIQSFPLLYYGIGNQTTSEPLARFDADQIFLKQRILRQVLPNFFFGLELDLQRINNVTFKRESNATPFIPPRGAGGSTNLGIGLGIVYDNRHNILNVRNGFFSELALLRYEPTFGSSFSFQTIISDTRIYRPLGKRNVIAGQLFGQFTSGDVPFNQLALMGGETLMRGYYTGRYRDKNYIATQLELRFLPLPLSFTDRIGMGVFGGTGTVFDSPKSFDLNTFVWKAGAGARFLLFPNKDVYTRFDVAFTREGQGYYLFIGEAF